MSNEPFQSGHSIESLAVGWGMHNRQVLQMAIERSWRIFRYFDHVTIEHRREELNEWLEVNSNDLKTYAYTGQSFPLREGAFYIKSARRPNGEAVTFTSLGELVTVRDLYISNAVFEKTEARVQPQKSETMGNSTKPKTKIATDLKHKSVLCAAEAFLKGLPTSRRKDFVRGSGWNATAISEALVEVKNAHYLRENLNLDPSDKLYSDKHIAEIIGKDLHRLPSVADLI